MTASPSFAVHPLTDSDLAWLREQVSAAFGSPQQASRGRLMRVDEHAGVVAETGAERLGFEFEIDLTGAGPR